MKTFGQFCEALANTYDQESAFNMLMAARNIASNSYQRTRLWKEYPVDVMQKWFGWVDGQEKWVKRTGFPVPLRNLQLARSALSDMILNFRKEGGMLHPATYKSKADPSSAETLPQFANFLNKRVMGGTTPSPQFAQFAEHWENYIADFQAVYNREFPTPLPKD